MRALSSFDRFERCLRADTAEVFGGQSNGKKPGRPRKQDTEVGEGREPVWNAVKLPNELAAQVEGIAESLDLHRTGLARMIVAAGIEAILVKLETGEGMTLPIRFAVTAEKPGFYRQHLRTVTPERFEALRSRYPWPLPKWKGLQSHRGDATGTPMPPPSL